MKYIWWILLVLAIITILPAILYESTGGQIGFHLFEVIAGGKENIANIITAIVGLLVLLIALYYLGILNWFLGLFKRNR